MQWIKTQQGNFIRLGSIAGIFTFKNTANEYEINITVNGVSDDNAVEAAIYKDKEQAESVMEDLMDFIDREQCIKNILELPQMDNNFWLKKYDISRLNLNKENMLRRSGYATVYNLMKLDENSQVRGISKEALMEILYIRDEFIEAMEEQNNV